jgi:sugar O-acyltransferase (sialic acid O-acetyltransferase NeuD family)
MTPKRDDYEMEAIAIYGAGGFARELAWVIEDCCKAGQPYSLVGFIDDNADSHGKILNELPIRGLEQTRSEFPHAKIIGAVGKPALRELLTQKAKALGFEASTIVHPSTIMSRFVALGEGSVICPANVITTNIRIGRHVQINAGCIISHDAIIDDFVTLTPGVHLSGCVHLGKRVYVGTGAVIINGTPSNPIVIGDDAVIGAGACVTKSVPPGVTVVGVPARPIERA